MTDLYFKCDAIYELLPMHDPHKSFYKKAVVTVNNSENANERKTLFSYGTKVAYIDTAGVPHLLNTFNYSATTLRHCKEFILQAGYEIATAHKLWEMYGNLHIAENYEKAKTYKAVR